MSARLSVCFSMVMLFAFPMAVSSKLRLKPAPEGPSPLDRYIEDVMKTSDGGEQLSSPGSLWRPDARLSDIGSELRASRVGDIVTVVVSEQASAVTKGTVKSARTSSLKANVDAIGGLTKAKGPLANLAGASSQSALDGEGSSSRESVLTTTIAARVAKVLPNGYLILEGSKNVVVNSDSQLVTVRGVVRPVDLSTGNVVTSDRIAQMEIKISGKGLIADSIRRPFILYRILMGLLPF